MSLLADFTPLGEDQNATVWWITVAIEKGWEKIRKERKKGKKKEKKYKKGMSPWEIPPSSRWLTIWHELCLVQGHNFGQNI